MEMFQPRISVLTIVGEDRSLFYQSAHNLEAQSLQDFEFVAVDRGANAVVSPLLWEDRRLRVVAAPGLGEDAAWNWGFEHCRGEYVAILAGGHASRPVRLARQAAWLDRYPGVVLVGTASGLRQPQWEPPPEPARTDRDIIHWSLLAGAEMAWSSLMLRRATAAAQGELLRGAYGEAARLNLCLRLCAVGDVTRIDEVLTLCPAEQGKPGDARLRDVQRALMEFYERILSAGYGPILGDGAARAADLVTRHLVGDAPVPDAATSEELETVLATLAHSLQPAGGADIMSRAASAAERGATRKVGASPVLEAAPPAMPVAAAAGAPPRVSVLTVADADAARLADTVESIRAQGLEDFELLVVDRGGTEAEAVLASCQDGRLRLVAAHGISEDAAWNLGFSECRGAYVAMRETGDISRPARLAREAAWLDRNEAVVLVGTASAAWQADRQPELQTTQTDRGVVLWLLHAGVELAWSSLMVRRESVGAAGPLLREAYGAAAKFDLCHRMGAVGDVTRLDEVLTLCRGRPGPQGGARFDAVRRVLEEAYAPILAERAARSAELVARHVAGHAPVQGAATLDEIEAVLVELGHALKATGKVDGVSRAMIAVERGALRDRLARQAGRLQPAAVAAVASVAPGRGGQLGAAFSAIWRGGQGKSQTPAAARWGDRHARNGAAS